MELLEAIGTALAYTLVVLAVAHYLGFTHWVTNTK
jgi:hypothetical protein